VIATFPNEVYSEIGLAVKKRSPFDNTLIFTVAGGYGGYVPTAAEYLEGGYVANGSPFAPESEEVMISSSLNLINRLKGTGESDVYSTNKISK
jgi:neutral ceramidase